MRRVYRIELGQYIWEKLLEQSLDILQFHKTDLFWDAVNLHRMFEEEKIPENLWFRVHDCGTNLSNIQLYYGLYDGEKIFHIKIVSDGPAYKVEINEVPDSRPQRHN